MIEDIEGIHAQPKVEAFGDLRVLLSGQIDRSEAGSVDHISGHVPETITCVLITACGYNPSAGAHSGLNKGHVCNCSLDLLGHIRTDEIRSNNTRNTCES